MLSTFHRQRNEHLIQPFILTPQKEFETALENHPTQVFAKKTGLISLVLQTHEAFQGIKEAHLNADEAWQGLKLKAEFPHIFTNSIVAAAVIEGSRRQTPYGEVFNRVSVQPDWLTDNLVLVKEETHIDNEKKQITFLGRPLDIEEAKQLLVPQLLDEMFDKKSEKALKVLSKEMSQSEALDYFTSHFETHFAKENPPLFHVQQGIIGEMGNPQETWVLVRLDNAPKTLEEQKANLQLKEQIASFISWKLYLETLKALGKDTPKNKLKISS